MWLVTVATILIGYYIILIRIFRTGWKSLEYYEPPKNIQEEISFKTSVVVCCHNEERNLPHLLQKLQEQNFQGYELIIVNDHSTDRTEEIILNAKSNFPQLIYIQSDKRGKKFALLEGIEKASGEFIITTDADCLPEKTWLETIVSYQYSHSSDLLICPVKLKDKKTFFSRLQAFEFTSLVAAGAGAAGANMPILCNAANLAFTKTAWEKSKLDLKLKEQSGDDIFLLQSIKKRGGAIRFLQSKKAFVSTEPAKNTSAFFRQRRRWAGKSTAYTDWQLIFTACTVFGISLAQLGLLIAAFFNTLFFYFFVLFFVLKYFFDTKFLSDVSRFYSLKAVPFYSFALSLVYPFYIVITAISAILFKPKKWK